MQPTCHVNHLPPFLEKIDELKAKGVDAVYVLSVNDPFVLSGWTRVQGVADKVRRVSPSPVVSTSMCFRC